jgi:hypothetical protein
VGTACGITERMTRRAELIQTIQRLSSEEGMRQPNAAEWLATQDALAQERRKKSAAAPRPGAGRSEGEVAPDEPIA